MSEPLSPKTDPTPGPRDGDYVGYLKKLEQTQIERLNLPPDVVHPVTSTPSTAEDGAPANPFSPEHRALMRARFAAAKEKVGPLGLLQLIQALIGAGLLVASLSEQGNFMMLAIGIALMWQPLTRLQRLLHVLNPKAAQPASITNLFGKSKKKP